MEAEALFKWIPFSELSACTTEANNVRGSDFVYVLILFNFKLKFQIEIIDWRDSISLNGYLNELSDGARLQGNGETDKCRWADALSLELSD